MAHFKTIIGLEGTTHDPSFLQENSQIHGSCYTKTNVSVRSSNQSPKVTIDVEML